MDTHNHTRLHKSYTTSTGPCVGPGDYLTENLQHVIRVRMVTFDAPTMPDDVDGTGDDDGNGTDVAGAPPRTAAAAVAVCCGCASASGSSTTSFSTTWSSSLSSHWSFARLAFCSSSVCRSRSALTAAAAGDFVMFEGSSFRSGVGVRVVHTDDRIPVGCGQVLRVCDSIRSSSWSVLLLLLLMGRAAG